MSETAKLLAEFASNGSESAFRELVRRYSDLVYSTAMRLVRGDSGMAQDVAQTVFVDLARKAKTLPPDIALGGWLHRHTCFVASNELRAQSRRQFREQQAVEMNSPDDHTAANLARIAPILDEAINQLPPDDRAAILLRYFEQLDFRAIGNALGKNEDATRMRVNRALDKLEILLKERGVVVSAAGLALALEAGAVSAAPPGLAAALAGVALAGTSAGGAIAATSLKGLSMLNLKLALVGIVAAAAVAVPLVVQHQTLVGERAENAALHRQVSELTPLATENEKLSNQIVQMRKTPKLPDDQTRELLRLRGEVGILRERTNQLAKAVASAKMNKPRVATGFTGNKRIFRGTSMKEFVRFISEVVGAPVKDQTGLTGSYDIALDPPRIGANDDLIPRTIRILRDDLGLQLAVCNGPFSEEEMSAVSNSGGGASVRGYALSVVSQNSPGFKVASDDANPFGDFVQDRPAVTADADGSALAGTETGDQIENTLRVADSVTSVKNACVNNLRLIDSAKQQWALEFRQQRTSTPKWEDIQPYFARPNGELPSCPLHGTYTIGSVGDPPTCSVEGHKLP